MTSEVKKRAGSPPSKGSEKPAQHHEYYDNYLVDSDVWNSKGADFARKGFHKEALACFEKAIKCNPNSAKAWYNKGTSLCVLGLAGEDALHCFDVCIEINPMDAGAWTNRGTILFQMGRYDEAVQSYDRALEIHPVHSSAWTNKGLLYNSLGMKKKAKECFKKAESK